MKRFILLVLVLFLVAACGGGGGVKNSTAGPDWVRGGSSKYPNTLYITGVGQAASLADAKNRARADVAKVFEVVIHEQTQSNMQYVSNASGEEISQQVQSSVSTRTDKVLSGVEIGDTWRDPQSGQYFALAVLNRNHSAHAFRVQIESLDSDTQIRLDKAKKSSDILDKVANDYAALTAQLERSGLQRSLQVVDQSGMGIPPQWELARLSTDLREDMSHIRITTRANGPDGFAEQVNGVLGRTGFLVKPGDRPDFTLSATLDMGKPLLRNGWYWINARMEILLSDAQARIRGSKRWNIKESATSEDLAKRRAIDKAVSILQEELRPTLLGFAKE